MTLNGALRKRLRLCPYCGREMLDYRLGVNLPRLKIVIFDLIRRNGFDGIHIDDLHKIINHHHPMTRKTLKAHFFQINKRIASTGHRITSRSRFVRLVSVWKK